MNELQKQILSLTVPERLQLIAFIATSISQQEVDEQLLIPDEWIAEAQNRDQNYKSGKSKAFTWDEVKAGIHAGK